MKKFILILLTTIFAANAFAAPQSFAPIVKDTRDGVVHINTKRTVTHSQNPFMNDEALRWFFGGPPRNPAPERKYETTGTGSGFVIDKSGYVVTNNHVIADATEIIVRTSDNKEYKAALVGRDSLTDLALLKIDPKNTTLKPLPIGNSDNIEVGDWVIAIGSARALDWTVTAGIVSAKGRNLGAGPYDNFIQTDASINPGNSGGPLINMSGEVVGINTMIMQNSQGLGFAVPSNTLQNLLSQLKGGHVRRGWLGITLQDIDEKLAESFGLPDTNGTIVADVVLDSPAARAGVRSGDIIRSIDGVTVENSSQLVHYIGSKMPDQTVRLVIIREGKTINTNLRLAERPNEDTPITSGSAPAVVESMFSVRDITAAEKQQLGLQSGVIITSVKEDSNAAKAGLMPGMAITWINRRDVANAKQFTDLYNAINKGGNVSVRLVMPNGTRFVAFTKE